MHNQSIYSNGNYLKQNNFFESIKSSLSTKALNFQTFQEKIHLRQTKSNFKLTESIFVKHFTKKIKHTLNDCFLIGSKI